MSIVKSKITSPVVIGYGRFGELLASLLKKRGVKLAIIETDKLKARRARDEGYQLIDITKIGEWDYIFLCVPISRLTETAKAIKPFVTKKHTIVDVCSVKQYPMDCLRATLPDASIVGTHPMFGPDSAQVGLAGSRLALCSEPGSLEQAAAIRNFWQSYDINVIETTPDLHDRDAAYSQAFAYIMAKIALAMELPDITFRTRSYDWIEEIARLSGNDTEQLFHDIIAYNPYVPEMVERLTQMTSAVDSRVQAILLEKRSNLF